MEIREYLAAIKKWAWLLCLVVVVSMGISAIVSLYLLEPIYESTATIMIKRSKAETKMTDSELPSSNVIKIYNNLLESETIIQSIKDGLELHGSLEDVRKLIKVDADDETGFIKIVTKSTTPHTAQAIAMALIENLRLNAEKIDLTNTIHVIDEPKLPDIPAYPKPLFNMALSFVGGLMLGFLALVFFHSLEQSAMDIPMLKAFPDIPVIGRISRLGARNINRIQKSRHFESIHDSYKNLRTEFLYQCQDKERKTILITSPYPSEGKTLTATHLAVAVAQLKYNVLLIEANFLRPDIENYFALKQRRGLTHYFYKNESICKVYPAVNIELDVIADGFKPEDPTLVLESAKMKSLMEMMKAQYDFVIIDGPPVFPTADAQILAKLVDGVVLVMDYRRLNQNAIRRTIDALKKINAQILGFVVNKLPK